MDVINGVESHDVKKTEAGFLPVDDVRTKPVYSTEDKCGLVFSAARLVGVEEWVLRVIETSRSNSFS